MKHKLLFSPKVLLVVFAFLMSGCGGAKEFVCNWPAQEIQIDGKNQDWQSQVQMFADEKYSAGFENDSKYLYLCFATTDRDKIFQIMRSGLSVSFESGSDSKKDYTVRFPLINPGAYRESVGLLGQDEIQKESVGFLFKDLLEKQMYFSIIQDEFANTVSLNNKENIEAKAGIVGDALILELKAPLAATESSFPIGAMPGENIRVNISIDSSPILFRTASEVGQSAPGGQSGGGGGRGGRGGGGNRGGGNATADAGGGSGPVSAKETFTVKCDVKLINKSR